MSRNRYIGDYRIVESLDGRGRIRTDVEYIGAAYDYAGSPQDVHSAKMTLALCCILGWTAFFIALFPVSTAMHTLYVSLTFGFSALPLALTTGNTLSLFRTKAPFEHRHADRLQNRAPAGTFFLTLFCALSLVGEGVNLIRGVHLLPGDLLFSLGAGIGFLCGAVGYRQWKRLCCSRVE